MGPVQASVSGLTISPPLAGHNPTTAPRPRHNDPYTTPPIQSRPLYPPTLYRLGSAEGHLSMPLSYNTDVPMDANSDDPELEILPQRTAVAWRPGNTEAPAAGEILAMAQARHAQQNYRSERSSLSEYLTTQSRVNSTSTSASGSNETRSQQSQQYMNWIRDSIATGSLPHSSLSGSATTTSGTAFTGSTSSNGVRPRYSLQQVQQYMARMQELRRLRSANQPQPSSNSTVSAATLQELTTRRNRAIAIHNSQMEATNSTSQISSSSTQPSSTQHHVHHHHHRHIHQHVSANPPTPQSQSSTPISTSTPFTMTLPRAPPTPVTATTRPTAPTRQHPALAQRPRSNYSNPFVHPQFRSKAVCKLFCRHCDTLVCTRGMKAILLGDTRVELYSTDSPPEQVNLVEKDYLTRNCQCRIRDIACLRCGNVIGYHVTQPCEICLESCNNGHFWMFLADGVASRDRVATGDGTKKLLWAMLPCVENDVDVEMNYDLLCR